ncbi:SPOR domain-containing protein [Larsenimonas salina]|uniref:SPOR domain-containing protein n=1 Tax=Larsenimonas salina TaxID=1295565 RepID=UPI0020732181|nr:SPOR domain-containing protein [Larsenimonas salina]MCM5704150.1 SPOR domain-containing protein [Larsenimonas salina]
MARTPSKKSAPQSRKGASSRGAQKKKPITGPLIPGWLWAAFGIVGGFIFAYYLMHDDGSQTAPAKPSEPASVIAKPVDRSAAKNAASSDASESGDDGEKMPSFDFYTLLPETEVVAPDVKTYRSTPKTPEPDPSEQAQTTQKRTEKPTANLESGQTYLLQAASFQSKKDAQKLADKLKNLGIIIQLTTVTTADNTTWYRVQAGPYKDGNELARAQGLMQTQGITPLVMKQK